MIPCMCLPGSAHTDHIKHVSLQLSQTNFIYLYFTKSMVKMERKGKKYKKQVLKTNEHCFSNKQTNIQTLNYGAFIHFTNLLQTTEYSGGRIWAPHSGCSSPC